MKAQAILLAFLVLTLLPAGAALWIALDDRGEDLRRLEASTRAALDAEAVRAAVSMRELLESRVTDALARLETSAARLAAGKGLADGVAVIDAAGLEVAPVVVARRRAVEVTSEEELALHARALEMAAKLRGAAEPGDLLEARESLASLAGSLSDPTLRGDLLVRVARLDLALDRATRAELLLRHVFETFEDVRSPHDEVPLDLVAASLLARGPSSSGVAELLEEARERLWRQRSLLSTVTLESLRRWPGLRSDDSGEAKRWEHYLATRRETLLGLAEAMPASLDGEPIVARSPRPTLFVFRRLDGNGTDRPELHAVARVSLEAQPPPGHAALGTPRWLPAREVPQASAEQPASVEVTLVVPQRAGDSIELPVGALAVRSDALAEVRARAERDRVRQNWAIGLLSVLAAAGGVGLVVSARREAELVRVRADLIEHVAHELRTPAATVGVFSELIESRDAPVAKRDQYLRFVAAEAQRIGYVVENILDLSLPGRGLRFETESVDLCELLESLAGAFRPRCESDGIALDVRIEKEKLPRLQLFRRGVARIVFNLLDNALKYRRRHSKAEIGLEATKSADGRFVLITVRDNGPGIPPGNRRHIFRRPFRAARPEQPGCGVGLAISARLAKLVGGELRYRPRPGGGSEFTLSLAAS